MNLFHGVASILHREESFLIDVCGLDGVYLVFEHGNLGGSLFEGMFMGFLAFQGGSSSCIRNLSAGCILQRTNVSPMRNDEALEERFD